VGVRLARHRDQHRFPDRGEHVEGADGLELQPSVRLVVAAVVDGQARIHQQRPGDPRRAQLGHPGAQQVGDHLGPAGVERPVPHRERVLPLDVHRDRAGAGVTDDRHHPRVAKAAGVVHDRSTGRHRGDRHLGLPRVARHHEAVGDEQLQGRQQAVEFLTWRERPVLEVGGLRAQVDDRRAELAVLPGLGQCRLGRVDHRVTHARLG
jgi:hypothetical protein